MDILKLIKFTIIIFFISCNELKIQTHIYEHEKISIKDWNIKDIDIKNAVLLIFKKNSDFKILEQKKKISKIRNGYKTYKSTSLKFDSLPVISTNKDYKLIINDTIIYNIKNIKTDKIVDKYGFRRVDTIYNMIKSMNINSKEYKFDKAGIFFIPKDTYIIEK